MMSVTNQGDLFDFARGRGGPTGRAAEALETGRSRLLVTGLVVTMAFAALGWRVVDLTLFTDRAELHLSRNVNPQVPVQERADIVDRNGIVVATSLPAVSLYADPKHVLDVQETADKLIRALPDLDREKLEKRLASRGRFVYLKRNLTPEQHYEVHRLGLPGIQFERGERRVYPQGRLLAHALGVTDIDGRGTAGIERHFDSRLTGGAAPLRLSIDLRIQAVVHEVLSDAVKEFSALGGTAVVMDANTSELVAMVSLPDFDPNRPVELLGEAGFNRATKGVYEMGSTFKLLTAAMALDSGVVPISGGYDASKPLRIARFTITDYHAKNRWLSVPEILIHSSNIGAAKMALDVGTKAQQTYLGRLGLLRPSPV
ncbi:MAG: penicillin-binding protein, partial [Rhodospirillales bacterium CG15_BIG_FIL_POST_REV_8_21_14_020_66_15]